MQFRTVFLSAAIVSAVLLLAGCGGGGGGDSSNGGGGSTDTAGNSPSAPTPSTPGTAPNGGQAICQSQPVVGGDLFVAEKGPAVTVTLLANGGLTGGTFMFFYDIAFGINVSNPQDKWGQDRPFRPTAPVGTSTDEQLLPASPPDFVNGMPFPSTYPKGVPIELWLSLDDGNFPGPANVSSTASIFKDLPHDPSHSASVVYRGDNTATVTFFAGVGGPAFTVGLTNVSGKASTCTF